MYRRLAIYYTPTGPFAARGAAWLGRDLGSGADVVQPQGIGIDLAALTHTPRRYGFHATLKAPFHLAEGVSQQDARTALAEICARHRPADVEGLEITPMGRFLAFTPVGDVAALNALAGAVVTDLDHLRAPLDAVELGRRRKAGLRPAQEAHLTAWGYPHVLDQFRFHMTLTGKMPKAALGEVAQAARMHFSGTVPAPLVVDALALIGERQDGCFETIVRVPLTG